MTIEEAIVAVFNSEGWKLTIKNNNAEGLTMKGKTCLLLIRKKAELAIEEHELTKLSSSGKEVQLYMILNNNKGYIFWVNDLVLRLYDGKYPLEESQASLIYGED
jgi:hypothetical protein